MEKSNKENIIGVGLSTFTGIIGAILPYSFDVKSWVAGVGCAIAGTVVGAAFKESRRGVHESRPGNFILPYIAGAVISSLAAVGLYFIA